MQERTRGTKKAPSPQLATGLGATNPGGIKKDPAWITGSMTGHSLRAYLLRTQVLAPWRGSVTFIVASPGSCSKMVAECATGKADTSLFLKHRQSTIT